MADTDVDKTAQASAVWALAAIATLVALHFAFRRIAA